MIKTINYRHLSHTYVTELCLKYVSIVNVHLPSIIQPEGYVKKPTPRGSYFQSGQFKNQIGIADVNISWV